MKKKFLTVFLCFLLSASMLAGCNGAEDQSANSQQASTSTEGETQAPVPPTDYSEKSLYPADVLDQLKIYGRSAVIEKSITCDWTASGIEFVVDCQGKISLEMTTDIATYLTVYIDGVRADTGTYNTETNVREGATFYLDVGTHQVELAKDLEPGLHTVKVLKQNMEGNTCIDRIILSGELRQKPVDQELFIEFVGDSITCGYAAWGTNKTDDKVGPETTDGTATYAYLTAQALGADHSMVCISGIGIYKGFLTYPMTDVYPYINYRRDHSEQDFKATRNPDVVVVNLGTNDEDRIGTNKDEFKAHVENLIAQIRDTYTEETKIVFCYNSMKQGKKAPDLIDEVITAKGGADSGLYSLVMTTDISPISPTKHTHNGAPGNHPNAEQHQKQAATLTAFLTEILK